MSNVKTAKPYTRYSKEVLVTCEPALFTFYKEHNIDLDFIRANAIVEDIMGLESTPQTRKWVRDRIAEYSMPIKRRIK